MTALPPAFISGIGGGELLLIFVVFLLLFGAKKLPGMARSLGKSVAEFQRAAREVREEFLSADREIRTAASETKTAPPATDESASDAAREEIDDWTAGTPDGTDPEAYDEYASASAPIEPVREDAPVTPPAESASAATGEAESAAEAPAASAADEHPDAEAPADAPPAAAAEPADDGHVEDSSKET